MKKLTNEQILNVSGGLVVYRIGHTDDVIEVTGNDSLVIQISSEKMSLAFTPCSVLWTEDGVTSNIDCIFKFETIPSGRLYYM